VINEVITNFKKIKQTVKEWEERQQMEEGCRKNKILISGLEGRTRDTLIH
jgi:hypothetical protein